MNIFEAAAKACHEGIGAAFVTIIGVTGSTPRAPGARMLVRVDGSVVGTIGGGKVEHQVLKLAKQVIATGKPMRYHTVLDADSGMGCGGDMEFYIEPLRIRTPMVLFGAGHVAQATAPLLRDLHFHVTIVDDRENLMIPERFPGCQIRLGDPLTFAQDHDTTDHTHFLLMTHLHQRDRNLLHVLTQRPHAWIGMLGSRRKIANIFRYLREQGVSEEQLAQVNTPVGLDIGAETPKEIAVSIAAQLIQVRRSVNAASTAP